MLLSISMGHRFVAAVPVMLVWLLASCDGSAPTDTYELSGRVTVLLETPGDDTNISGARITFTSDTLIATETVTDESGRYRMRVQTDHDFGQVRAEADGFSTHETTVYFDSPQRRIDIELRRLSGEP